MKKILYILLIVILILYSTFMLFSIFDISFLGFRVYKIGSGSMYPYLKVNDIIVVKKSNFYNIDDVITYTSNDGTTVTHRIISIDGDNILTKGDANNTNDKEINKNKIVGKLVFKISNMGFVYYMLAKPSFWIIFFISGIIITIIIPEKRRSEEENTRGEN